MFFFMSGCYFLLSPCGRCSGGAGPVWCPCCPGRLCRWRSPRWGRLRPGWRWCLCVAAPRGPRWSGCWSSRSEEQTAGLSDEMMMEFVLLCDSSCSSSWQTRFCVKNLFKESHKLVFRGNFWEKLRENIVQKLHLLVTKAFPASVFSN